MSGERETIQQIVDSVFSGKGAPVVLEAGCGSLSHVRFPPDAHIVGIDISAGQLERNKNLSERIHGDIQDYDLPEQRYDAIVCWDVLEHLQRPESALERFNKGIRHGGIIILSASNPLSPKGIITKLTPFAFHIWFYRNVRGWKEAGTKGNPPFPTYLRLSMGPRAIARFAQQNGLTILHRSVGGYGDSRDVVGRRNKRVDMAMKVVNTLCRVVSLGFIKPKSTQYYFVLQKKPAADSN
jgi:2-polyprenyl-3-methyl-5-hydroxy-6-metoxy-1,4-benzoquinol methylase